MADWNDLGLVWDQLHRVENQLKGIGLHGSRQFDSLGRLASSASHIKSDWALEQLGRVGRVRKALNESGPLAQRLAVDSLAGISLPDVWPILLAASKEIALYYGGSVIAGTAIGGVGGAFFGGVGAIPGAAAGATVGSYVGGVVLAMLGLKSMLDGAAESFSECFTHYQSGFVQAWGPLRQDTQHGYGSSSRGDTTTAANDFARGHLILITAILAAMVAYLTRGRGNKELLFNEIGRSPRLGPRVANWVKENEDRLRSHPALQSRKRGASAGQPPPPPPPKRRSDSDRDEGPKRMPKTDVPCFAPNDLPDEKIPEFDRQLAGQEAGLNNMTVDEYIRGREAFDTRQTIRDPNIARQERVRYENSLREDLERKFREDGLGLKAAQTKAKNEAASIMSTLAALHNPDMKAAGKDVICDFGDRNVNCRIGAQWSSRLDELDKAAGKISKAIRGTTKLNAKLSRCK